MLIHVHATAEMLFIWYDASVKTGEKRQGGTGRHCRAYRIDVFMNTTTTMRASWVERLALWLVRLSFPLYVSEIAPACFIFFSLSLSLSLSQSPDVRYTSSIFLLFLLLGVCARRSPAACADTGSLTARVAASTASCVVKSYCSSSNSSIRRRGVKAKQRKEEEEEEEEEENKRA